MKDISGDLTRIAEQIARDALSTGVSLNELVVKYASTGGLGEENVWALMTKVNKAYQYAANSTNFDVATRHGVIMAANRVGSKFASTEDAVYEEIIIRYPYHEYGSVLPESGVTEKAASEDAPLPISEVDIKHQLIAHCNKVISNGHTKRASLLAEVNRSLDTLHDTVQPLAQLGMSLESFEVYNPKLTEIEKDIISKSANFPDTEAIDKLQFEIREMSKNAHSACFLATKSANLLGEIADLENTINRAEVVLAGAEKVKSLMAPIDYKLGDLV